MKLRISLPLVFVALLLLPNLALAAASSGPQPQPNPAASRLFADLTPDASSCASVVSPSVTPEPLFRSDPLLCGGCTGALCAGKFVGAGCGIAPNFRCVIGPTCAPGGITCLCQAP